uniref:Uncharacterized protein n=1 Tax=Ceratitis capitata TaxID=7213 RepID=W8C3H9_CERCA
MTDNVTTFEMITSSAFPSVTKENFANFANTTLMQTANASTTTTTETITTDDTTPTDTDIERDDSGLFILIPFAVVLVIVVLSALVFLIGRNRRRLARTYCRRRHEHKRRYGDDSDTAMEHGEAYDFDDPSECLLKGKLQIDNRYDSNMSKSLYT